MVVAGNNYGKVSSCKVVVLLPRFMDAQSVIARSFARIHKRVSEIFQFSFWTAQRLQHGFANLLARLGFAACRTSRSRDFCRSRHAFEAYVHECADQAVSFIL